MTIRVLAVGNNNTTQADHRSLITALTQPSASNLQRAGFFPSSNVGGLTNVSAMVVGVAGFRAIVSNSGGSGSYLVQSDAQINLTFDPGEAGVTRTDRIIVRVYNNSQDSLGLDEARVEYLKGQSSGTASALPAGSLLLWEIPVPAGASSGTGGINFTGIAVDKRVYTTAVGGVIPLDSSGNLTDGTIANPYEGMMAYVKPTDILYICDGSGVWRPKGQINVSSFSALANVINPEEGTLAYTRDNDTVYLYNGGGWQKYPALGHGGTKGMLSSSSTLNSTTYADLPGAASLSFNFTKIRTDSKVVARMKVNMFSDVNSMHLQLGMRIGTTDYDVGKQYYTNGNLYLPASGEVTITGLTTGTYSITGRYKRISGTGNFVTNNTISELDISITEIPA